MSGVVDKSDVAALITKKNVSFKLHFHFSDFKVEIRVEIGLDVDVLK